MVSRLLLLLAALLLVGRADASPTACVIAGILDPTPISDGAGTLSAIRQGDLLSGAISTACAFPYAFEWLKGVKAVKWVRVVSKVIARAAKNGEFAKRVGPALKGLHATTEQILTNKTLRSRLPTSIVDAVENISKQLKKYFGEAAEEFAEKAAKGKQARSPSPNKVQANKAAGDAWEEEVVNTQLPKTQTHIQPQITIKSGGPSGKKVRLDAVGTDSATGDVKLTDAKASATAPHTPNQKVVHPELEVHGGTVVGKGKPPYVGGTPIPPTKVDIIRKL